MRHFYKVISHSASAYGGEDEAAAKAVFTHQKKLIEDGHTQAHQVFLYKDGAVIDSHTLEEDEKPNPRFVANASRQQFLDEVHPGAANGVSVSGAFLSTTIEDEYQLWRASEGITAYQRNIEARQAYYDSLGQAVPRDMVNTTHPEYVTNTSGQFVLSNTEHLFDLWQAQQAEPESEFTQAEQAAIHSMRSRGFAIVIFTPKELAVLDDTVSTDDLETRMIEVGNDFIDNNSKE